MFRTFLHIDTYPKDNRIYMYLIKKTYQVIPFKKANL